jgi:hypothetical protein
MTMSPSDTPSADVLLDDGIDPDNSSANTYTMLAGRN